MECDSEIFKLPNFIDVEFEKGQGENRFIFFQSIVALIGGTVDVLLTPGGLNWEFNTLRLK